MLDVGRWKVVDNTTGMLGLVSQKNTERISNYTFRTIKASSREIQTCTWLDSLIKNTSNKVSLSHKKYPKQLHIHHAYEYRIINKANLNKIRASLTLFRYVPSISTTIIYQQVWFGWRITELLRWRFTNLRTGRLI